MNTRQIGIGVLLFLAAVSAGWAGTERRDAVGRVLDRLHAAAAEADGEAYFGLFTPDAVFIGTDSGERWDLEAFRDYALPYFEKGQGWEYRPRERHVTLGPKGETAWFSELLDNDKYGLARGTGVLVRTDGAWKIAQYHLAFPIPNALSGEITSRIRQWRDDQPPGE